MPEPEDKKVFVEVTLCGKCERVKLPSGHLCPPTYRPCPKCGTQYSIEPGQVVYCQACKVDIVTGEPAPAAVLRIPVKDIPRGKAKRKKKPRKRKR